MKKTGRKDNVKEAQKKYDALPKLSREKVTLVTRKSHKVVAAAATNALMGDIEFCALLGISTRTMRNHLQAGPPRVSHANSGDIRLIRHFQIGKIRRWHRDSVEQFINGR